MAKNPKNFRTLYIGLFMFVLIVVGGYQAVVEFKTNIQALNLFEDSFKTPVSRFYKTRSVLNTIGSSSQAGPVDYDEIVYKCQELININRQINSYIVLDTNHKSLAQFSELKKAAQTAADSENGENFSKQLMALRLKYSKAGFLTSIRLISRALFTETLFNAEYLRAYEKEMEDNSKIAIWAREILQYVNYHLLGDTGDKAVAGKEDWFFYKQGVDYLTMPYFRENRTAGFGPEAENSGEDPIEAIVTFKKQLAKKDVDLLVVIAPGKASIYPEMLVSSYSNDEDKSRGVFNHSSRFYKELEKRGIETLNLHKAFVEEKQKAGQKNEYIYLKKDTHWRPRALELAASLVADKIKEYPWYSDPHDSVEYIEKSVSVLRTGDVTDMTKLESPGLKKLAIEFEKEKVLCNQVFKIKRDSTGAEVSRQLYRDDYRDSRILILGDSFSRIFQTDSPRAAGWISHLAKNLSEPLASIVNNGGASTLVREKLSRKRSILKGKKLLVWEFVERDIQFGAKGWAHVEL